MRLKLSQLVIFGKRAIPGGANQSYIEKCKAVMNQRARGRTAPNP